MSKHFGKTDNLFDIDPTNTELVLATYRARREQMEIHRYWEKMEQTIMQLGEALERKGSRADNAETKRLKGELGDLRDKISEHERRHEEASFECGVLKTIHHGPPELREGAKVALQLFKKGDRSVLPRPFGHSHADEEPLEMPDIPKMARREDDNG